MIGMIAAFFALAAALMLLFFLHSCFLDSRSTSSGSQIQALENQLAVLATVAFLIVFVVLMAVSVFSGRALYLKSKQAYDELNMFNDGLPAIVYRGGTDEKLTVEYISSGLQTLTGYTPDELRKNFNNHFIELVHPDDRERLIASIKYRMHTGPVIQKRYRVVRKDGSVVWLSVDSSYKKTPEGEISYGVMTDVSARVRTEREIAISREKFRIALKHSPNMVMEYLHKGSVLINSDPKAAYLGLPQRMVNSPESLIEAGYILPESVSTIRIMHEKIISGEEYVTGEIHVQTPGMDSDAWLRVDMTNIFMPDGEAAQAVVLIQDITKEKTAERDNLTGLYNRATAETLMRAVIGENPEAQHAFMMFDIDHFKLVNDTHGHYTGDSLLRAFAQTLSGCFRDRDIISRLGGDEFVVFMRDIRSKELAVQRAAAVIEAARNIELPGVKNRYGVSCGIAFFRSDGEDVKTLYKHADDALYRAKQAGRGRFVVYRDSDFDIM